MNAQLADLIVGAAREFPHLPAGEVEAIARVRLERAQNRPGGDAYNWWMQDTEMALATQRALGKVANR